MLSNLKLIFIHGINNQTTNYSQNLFERILKIVQARLKLQGIDHDSIQDILNRIVHHEVLWADLLTDLLNRYGQLEYQNSRFPWMGLMKSIDPLAIQITHYIKDKGDKHSGSMNILKEIDEDIQKIFFQTNIGNFIPGQEEKNAIFVAHSLGSVIAFDYIFAFRKPYNLEKNITVPSFITMGSPIPLFVSAMGYTDSEAALPPNVKKWVNIISKKDGVARYAKPFFKNIPIEEHEVSTGFFPLKAHAGYWNNNQTALIIADEVIAAMQLGLPK